MTDEQKLQLINELIEWNKWNMYVDLNDLRKDGYTHEEGKAYGKGHYDYGLQINKLLENIKKHMGETK